MMKRPYGRKLSHGMIACTHLPSGPHRRGLPGGVEECNSEFRNRNECIWKGPKEESLRRRGRWCLFSSLFRLMEDGPVPFSTIKRRNHTEHYTLKEIFLESKNQAEAFHFPASKPYPGFPPGPGFHHPLMTSRELSP